MSNDFINNPLSMVSRTGGSVKLTIADNVAVGPNLNCVSCIVKYSGTGPVTLEIGGTADADSFPIETTSTPVPIGGNLNTLNFYSATNGDIVNILWRR